MSLPLQKFREIVFQVLYSIDMGTSHLEDLLSLVVKEFRISKKDANLALEKAKEVYERREDIDKMITKVATSYEFERIQSIERNIIRLGIYELFYIEGIPPKVAISEAMRLARKFANPEASSFVNAILDQIYQASKKS
jgi:N utilization substance protein B